MDENEIAKIAVDSAIKIHRNVGYGLLESAYELIMAHELNTRGLHVARQVPIPIIYEGLELGEGFRADIILESKVIIELKCVEYLHNAHKKQLLTYLRLSGLKLGLLMNFSERLMKDGIVRIVNGYST